MKWQIFLIFITENYKKLRGDPASTNLSIAGSGKTPEKAQSLVVFLRERLLNRPKQPALLSFASGRLLTVSFSGTC